MRNGEAKQAIEAYQKAIKNKKRTIFFTQEPSAYNNLGQAYLYAEEYAPAVENFKKVIEMAPKYRRGLRESNNRLSTTEPTCRGT